MLTGGVGGFLLFDFVLRSKFWMNPPLLGDGFFDDVGGLFYSARIFDGYLHLLGIFSIRFIG